MSRSTPLLLTLAALATQASTASAQWNPTNGQWLKTDPADYRVMTYNIRDSICSTSNTKQESATDWTALAIHVAAFKPDVLILQEVGDNSGNGTGGGVDSVSALETTLDLFINGGTDPFRGGTVTAFVKKYDPNYDLPHIFVSSRDDGFNRNVILSRYPFVDLNGDGDAVASDIPLTVADAWNPTSGRGEIRGHQFAEIDLPDSVYAGDVVVGNAHLKSGGSSSDRDQRRRAAQRVAYYIHYLFNGAGTGTPDPNNKVIDNPPATNVLDENTPVIWGGDWNEDDGQLFNSSAPQTWFLRGGAAFDDGTDADLSDSVYEFATEFFSGSNATLGSSKLDYIAYHDSIATLRRSFVINSSRMNSNNANPPEFSSWPSSPSLLTGIASDHRPVVADFILPIAEASEPGAFDLTAPADGIATDGDLTFTWAASTDADDYTLTVATDPGLTNIVSSIPTSITSINNDLSAFPACATYYWGVTASNGVGDTASTPAARSFLLVAPADVTTDGTSNGIPDGDVTLSDFSFYLGLWGASDPAADLTTDGSANGIPDGSVTLSDFSFYLSLWGAGCP